MKCNSCKSKIKEKNADYCPFCGEGCTTNKYTDIVVILDRSGSMSSCKDATIKGFNGFLLEQAQVKGKATISLYQFNERYNIVYENKLIKNAPYLTDHNYKTTGATALLDTIGVAITNRVSKYSEIPNKPEQVLFVILTDGEENASKTFSKTQVKLLIEAKKEEGWQFAFIGAGIDAFDEKHAAGMSIGRGQTMAVDDSPMGFSMAFSSASRGTTKYRATGGQFLFNQEDKDDKD